MVAAIADCHVPDQFNAYRSPNAVAAQGFWLFQESLVSVQLPHDLLGGMPDNVAEPSSVHAPIPLIAIAPMALDWL